MFSRDVFGHLGFGEEESTLVVTPCITLSQTWNAPTVLTGVSMSIPAITFSLTWNTPIFNVFKITFYGSAFTESEFSSASFGEGGRTGDASVLVPEEISFSLTWNEPAIQAGVQVSLPNEIAIATTWNAPVVYAGASAFPDAIGATITWNIPSLEFIVNMPYAIFTQTWNIPDIQAGVFIDVLLTTMTTSWYAPAAQIGASAWLSSIELTQTWNAPTAFAGAQIQVPTITLSITWYEPELQPGVQAQIPAVIFTQTWNIPEVRPGVLATIPNEIAYSTTWNAPDIRAGVHIQAWNTETIQVARGSFSDASFSTHGFTEGRLESEDITYPVRMTVFWNAPTILPGVQIEPDDITLAQTWYPPEISARQRRVRVQYISH